MRVITGAARGRRLQTLEGQDVRPTTDKIKESVFSIIQFQISGRVFLDLFAGSGQMGIEALSRGAKRAYLVDTNLKAIRIIEQNLSSTGLGENAVVLRQDAKSALYSLKENIDVAYLDPPFGKGIIEETLPEVVLRMNQGGVIVCEYAEGESAPEKCGEFVLDRTYRYGKIRVSVYRHQNMV